MVESKLGVADYLIVIETNDMSFEVLKGSSQSSGPGAGVQAVSLVVGMGAQVILVGYISPYIANALAKQGIEVVTQVSGSVFKAVTNYIDSRSLAAKVENKELWPGKSMPQNQWAVAISMGLRQFYSFLPMLIGVVLLLGLFQGFVPQQTLLSLFSGSALQDSFWGACIGSSLAGNPVNSYVIGKSLFSIGVGLSGVTALMLAWVNVGLIQLPVESKALGIRFALIRNIAGFVVAVMMSFVVVWFAGGSV
ncbi:MAG: NifB/NifX family molybdenum-iron cluster-binding protein [Desulfobacterales bacterium]|nr:NifB/NifX family molybdenum-iron cluster-binding protein [Desulfobacterales bacterium]